MTGIADEVLINDFLQRVRRRTARRVEALGLQSGGRELPVNLACGKMLRTRFAARLAPTDELYASQSTIERACVAIETLHTATLCHDDVIDNAFLRREAPALWRITGPSAAVMIGDWLFCDAVQTAVEIEGGRYLGLFLSKVRETCRTESEHEIMFRGRSFSIEDGLRLARGKTGPLFSFVGHVCGGDDRRLAEALEEAGYCIGTAYQLADDLLDVVGSEEEAGKTLGTDAARDKFTLSQNTEDGWLVTRAHVAEQCNRALDAVAGWPEAQAGVRTYLLEDMGPLFSRLHLSPEDGSRVSYPRVSYPGVSCPGEA